MSTISPQGYNITDAPFNTNPFWEETIDGSIQSLSMTKRTEGDFDYYTWKYVDVDGEEHVFAEQRVSNKAGENGVTYTPNVSPDGTLTWTNDGGLSNPSPVNILGPRGETGPKGDKGDVGPTGPQGPEGPRGPQGIPGERGATGETGAPGLTGPQGPRGEAAYTFNVGTVVSGDVPSVTNSGSDGNVVLDFVVPRGEVGPRGERGPQGEIGPVGPQGAEGPMGQTGPEGPQGPIGATGPEGPKGDTALTLRIGSVTEGETASVTNGGTDTDIILDFVIPRGPAGASGEAATVSVGTVTTLEAGQPATVTNSGTENAAVFNFGIPKGEAGSSTGLYSYTYAELVEMGIVTLNTSNKYLTINSEYFVLANLCVIYNNNYPGVATCVDIVHNLTNNTITTTLFESSASHAFYGSVVLSPNQGQAYITNFGSKAVVRSRYGYEYSFSLPYPSDVSEFVFNGASNNTVSYSIYTPSTDTVIGILDNSVFYFTSPLS